MLFLDLKRMSILAVIVFFLARKFFALVAFSSIRISSCSGDSKYAGDSVEKRLARALRFDELDEKMGFARYKDPRERVAFLLNFQPVCSLVLNSSTPKQ